MSYYEHHIFFCCNQRQNGKQCCNDVGATEVREYAKAELKRLKGQVHGKLRVNSAGCLDRCELGPVLVIYPQGTWYTYVDKEDVDEIIHEHVLGGRVVERLLIDRNEEEAERPAGTGSLASNLMPDVAPRA